MNAVLAVNHLSASFRVPRGMLGLGSARLRILEDVSLTVDEGETLGIVGESGSGKTTLARAMTGLVARSGGDITFAGKAITGTRTHAFRHLRRETAMMFQDPVASLSPRLKIGMLVTEPFRIHGIAIEDRRAKAAELLSVVGLDPKFVDRYPHELSGGQARRAGVARALALRPKLVVADEPTAGLDVSIQGEVLNLMLALKEEFGLSYVIVTHNLAMIRHVSDRLAILYLGRVVEEGPTQQVFAAPAHPYTHSLVEAEPIPDPRMRRADLAIKGEVPSILNRPHGCEFHTRCPNAQERCRREAPVLAKIAEGHAVRCHFPLHQGRPQ
ncbi:ABC transporter ATP-binding protein [soil metagenome]